MAPMKTSDNFKVVQNRITSYSKFFTDFVPSEFPNNMNFQPATKKPKLDVIQSSSSSSNSCKSSPASDSKEKQSLLDELWGDDWSEDVIESCVLLETQICSQLPTTQQVNVEQTQNAVKISVKAGKQQNTKELPDDYSGRFVNNVWSRSNFRMPFRRTASGGDWSKAICNGSPYSNIQAVSVTTENDNKIKDKDSNALSSKFGNLSLEYKKLQERYQAKEGETSLLRTHLISTQNEVEKQKREKIKEVESIKQSMQASINYLTKEIDSLKTQLQFKSVEAEAVATKNQMVHIGNRVLPESPVPRHNVFNNCFDRSELMIPETNSDPQDKKHFYGSNTCKLPDLGHAKKWVSIHNCQLLNQLITPNVFHNAKLEPNYLDPPRSVSKPSLLSDLIDDDCGGNEMKTIPSPQPSTSKSSVEFNVFRASRKDSRSPCRQNGSDRNGLIISARTRHKELHTPSSALEESHLHLMKLTNLTDLDSEHAIQLIERVVLTCTKILWELQDRLVDADRQKNFVEREKELLLFGYTYIPLAEEYNLLDNKPWYRNEQGIEARRALGLLTALVQTAKHVMYIILPSLISSTASSNNVNGGIIQTALNADDENSNSKLKNLSAVTNKCDNDRPLKRIKLSNDSSKSDENVNPKPSDLLNIIKSIVEHIGKQRRTLMFEGVLAGVTIFVTSLLRTETELSQDTQKAVTEIVEQIVFSRPGPTVILKVFHLLLAAVHYSTIMNNLCHHSADKTCLEGYTHVTFTPDTCTMQVLCLLVRLVPTDHRFLVTDVYTAWLLSIFIADGDGPSWLYSDPSKITCQCRPNVSQLAFILLGEACNIYNSKGAEEYTEVLERILQRGIFLIHKLLYKDEHFVVNAGDCEGYYELFLHAVSNFEPPITLHQASKEVLENLCQQEAVRQPLHVVDAQSEELRSVVSSLYDTPNEDFMEND